MNYLHNGLISFGMKSTIILTIWTLLLLFSCRQNPEQQSLSVHPIIVKAKGYDVPEDSIGQPKVVPVTKRISQAGKLKKVLINRNEHPVHRPTAVPGIEREICTPGEDSFLLPELIQSIGNTIKAGIPTVVNAKEPSKDQNNLNFSSFGKRQGLDDFIMSLSEDKSGNLWIGAGGNGIFKYDGKSFTHFTSSEGLNNNYTKSIHTDKEGNIWIATFGRGFSKYDGKNFTHYSETEGLSHNAVWSMLPDRMGNIWIGAGRGGLDRYDGKAFRHYTAKEGFSNEIVTSMLEADNGHIWFGRETGVTEWNGKNFIHYTDKRGSISSPIVCMLEDTSGHFWFGMKETGMIKYDGKTFAHFTKKQGLSDDFIRSIVQDRKGKIWIATGKGPDQYDGKKFTRYQFKGVWCILEDKRSNLWFGTEGGGLAKYSGKAFTHYTEEDGLSSRDVRNFLEDKSGHLLIGTYGGGVTKYDGKYFSHLTTTQGLTINDVTCMLKDKSGNLWLCNYDGADVYNGKSFTSIKLNVTPMCILEDKKGDIWIGSFMSGAIKYDGKIFTQYTDKEGLSHNIIHCMAQDSTGNLWFGTYGGGINRFDGRRFTHFTKKEGLSDNDIVSMLCDSKGDLWIGTLNGGVNKYDGESFIHLSKKNGLNSNNIRSMGEDSRGNLWFGTDQGVSKLSKDKLDFLVKNSAGSRYVSKTTDPLFKNYTYEDGFSGDEVSIMGNTIFEADDSTIWIGASDRLTVYHPEEDITDTIAPNIQLTGVSLYNENIAWQSLMTSKRESKKAPTVVLGNGVRVHDLHFDSVTNWYGLPVHLSLAYDNNDLAFQYVGITTTSPQKVQYQYKIEGFNENWSALTSRSEANYSNLPHGKYTFKVKAMNGDGYLSNEYHYKFTIRPPWWHTWWAYTIFALVFIGTMYALFRYRLNKVRREHEIKHKTIELEMQALRAQMNPHFIFNSLNSINLFILENNKLQASEYLSKFSKLVRLILNNSREPFIPLEQELEALRLYLELESLRFEQRFNYKITVDKDIDISALKVPPLIIQPYAENAIWHGLMPKKEEGNLDISLYQQEDILICKITDDGIGRKKAAEHKSKSSSVNNSMGMRITSDRIAILQNEDLGNSYITINDLVLPDGSPGGTEVLLQIPVTYD
jgi:streptogramin lyase